MLGSTTFFAAMAVMIRIASADLSTYQVAFFRNLFGLLFLLPFLFRDGWRLPRTTQLPRYLVRCAIGVASMLCGFWALGNLPMAQAVALSYATPLLATVAAVFILGETVRMRRWSAVVIGLVGVLVIVRPGSEAFSAGSLVALGGALLSALVAIQIKQLSRVDAADTIVFYTYVFWVPMSLVPALFAWEWPQGITWLWLLLLGAFGTGGQLLWTRALKIGEVSALQPISFMQLPLVAVAAWLLFGEAPTRWTLIGAGIILGANIYIAHREVQLARRAATSAPAEAAKPGE
ncbi:DMT family transporter [Luteimonas sp. MC1828]|uniref:DMT family transporter n=1 Tax=Luteimonas sp. MC1828 TaxID=2799787 RepID=UPI0018F1DF2F|nr:DMT family transporter [Luteimonas sp. MC1828]MBJ7573720.1 DMT family transporter [Luteimonas sp. MC1828]